MKDKYRLRVITAMSEAQRFLGKAQEFIESKDDWVSQPAMKCAAMKRASMDLTRSLAQIRKPKY